jgi:hypothetical protein
MRASPNWVTQTGLGGLLHQVLHPTILLLCLAFAVAQVVFVKWTLGGNPNAP